MNELQKKLKKEVEKEIKRFNENEWNQECGIQLELSMNPRKAKKLADFPEIEKQAIGVIEVTDGRFIGCFMNENENVFYSTQQKVTKDINAIFQ